MSEFMTQDGFSYAFDPSACASCGGNCCTGESGSIFVSVTEIAAIAELLEMEEGEFRRTYLRKEGFRFSLKERLVEGSYDCAFFDRSLKGCSIYAARPLQCRTFPFWDYFRHRIDELKLECPGIIHD
ncbi:YkgJ family cysteine cluster protein [Sulfuricurvum sp.]|uniref:YkgJ family cysteine cluster protein n=1 Tax=Sulfuricurvum sp. TaxID=2025608 RepID=UPI002E326002|nr:YkgJ family cysteine cluster protein [Sulfuricurvum sp.]HEX5329396.1 YkgJ family cysteine cluster protein [Sulfuricurvum sp.]